MNDKQRTLANRRIRESGLKRWQPEIQGTVTGRTRNGVPVTSIPDIADPVFHYEHEPEHKLGAGEQRVGFCQTCKSTIASDGDVAWCLGCAREYPKLVKPKRKKFEY